MASARALEEVGRWLGVSVCLALVPAWLVFIDRGLRLENGLEMRTLVLIAVLLGLALVGAVASWRRSVGWMLAVALVSFVPIGFYFLLGRGPARLIGGLYAAFLLAAASAWAGHRAAGRRPHSTG
jgi:hypothetical protein